MGLLQVLSACAGMWFHCQNDCLCDWASLVPTLMTDQTDRTETDSQDPASEPQRLGDSPDIHWTCYLSRNPATCHLQAESSLCSGVKIVKNTRIHLRQNETEMKIMVWPFEFNIILPVEYPYSRFTWHSSIVYVSNSYRTCEMIKFKKSENRKADKKSRIRQRIAKESNI